MELDHTLPLMDFGVRLNASNFWVKRSKVKSRWHQVRWQRYNSRRSCYGHLVSSETKKIRVRIRLVDQHIFLAVQVAIRCQCFCTQVTWWSQRVICKSLQFSMGLVRRWIWARKEWDGLQRQPGSITAQWCWLQITSCWRSISLHAQNWHSLQGSLWLFVSTRCNLAYSIVTCCQNIIL